MISRESNSLVVHSAERTDYNVVTAGEISSLIIATVFKRRINESHSNEETVLVPTAHCLMRLNIVNCVGHDLYGKCFSTLLFIPH